MWPTRNNCPCPKGTDAENPYFPVPANPNFIHQPQVDEKTALILNIVTPTQTSPQNKDAGREKYPVLIWIHGGSLLYGSANYGMYDAVNFVSHSVEIGWPVLVVNFNYRLGLGGFLASEQISEELKRDGFAGNGNFGFTDQKVASEWVAKYIASFGGDPDNVTAFGQSAGAISIGHQMAAREPMRFHRAICMSGLGSTLLPRSLEEHQAIFAATCRYFEIDEHAPDVLDQLRRIPEQMMADADHIIQGVPSGTGNSCFDGWFYAHEPWEIEPAPPWIRSFMLGDVHDEGVIFQVNIREDTFETIRETLLEQVQDAFFVDAVLLEYGITPELSHEDLVEKASIMGAEAVFKIHNYKTALVNTQLRSQLFKYHFDQRSRLPNILKGLAYHGIDVLYLFMNLDNKLSNSERTMSRDLASAWIKFAWGQAPWESGTEHGPWELWGPDSKEQVETEEEDEAERPK
ncbi:para-nitrobenzyl esterase [Penicillium argentinense]|uniref:Para-nitrobenzyl esterase n=1 Tax=Penicillium argentinense TaxID=1131581 RepID=A0A9W9FEL2_9EURO|nr:para-nitrobenzyl esterase [Penicillium argentinense]KAJ5098808.1 para-nitrobenzyl esterase [Penicillium argentinense]